MKLTPEQVQILTEKLKYIKKSLESYNDYFQNYMELVEIEIIQLIMEITMLRHHNTTI